MISSFKTLYQKLLKRANRKTPKTGKQGLLINFDRHHQRKLQILFAVHLDYH